MVNVCGESVRLVGAVSAFFLSVLRVVSVCMVSVCGAVRACGECVR